MYYNINFFDKIIIFICCLIVYLSQLVFSISVAVVLVSIIFGGFLSYFDDFRPRMVLTVGFSVLACFVQALIFFLPIIAYDMFFNRSGKSNTSIYQYSFQFINLLGLIPVLNFFQTVPSEIISIVTAMLAFSLLLRYRSENQFKLHAKNYELMDAAREMTIKLENQGRELMEKQDFELNLATLNERNRIAREIHDNVGHLLSSAILQSGALLSICHDKKIKENLKALKDTLDQAMNSIRKSVHQLYDESIDLDTKVREIIGQFTFCDVSYDYSISTNPGRKLKYTFITVVKEALANIIKHSNATHVEIIFREHPAIYQLIIRDNGTVDKFSTDEGMGLKNMTDRVYSLNGNINITAKNGFEIFISVPKEGAC